MDRQTENFVHIYMFIIQKLYYKIIVVRKEAF